MRYRSEQSQATTLAIAIGLISAMVSLPSQATPRDQAKRIHDRLAGVPPSESVLATMASSINAGDSDDAAYLAMENSAFYNVTLKNMVTPWTNEAQTVFAPLNDYTATVIGLVRDDADFRQVLFGDVLYRGADGLGLPPYSNSDNAHYEALESAGLNLGDNNVLVPVSQSATTGLTSAATAGVLTSRAAAQAFFIDGTNRAMFRFTFMNHLCSDLEPLKDTSRPPDRIRQDVTRSPGGDSSIFLNSCIGCHAGMDPMTQAFAYYNWEYDHEADPNAVNGHLDYNDEGETDASTGSRVQAKYLINSNNFKYGYITSDDRWDNYWRQGQNSHLGWSDSVNGTGQGAKSLGQELANSQAFASCQVKKVFKAVCLREPVNEADLNQLQVMTTRFINSNYQLKRVFADSAVYCMGE